MAKLLVYTKQKILAKFDAASFSLLLNFNLYLRNRIGWAGGLQGGPKGLRGDRSAVGGADRLTGL
jgi:hypothetical protein